jgi:hypothetical protein
MVTRAVHIEIAHSLTSDSFLMALHRFIARRGKPIKICSDNGTNFVGAEKELNQMIQELDNKKVKNYFLMEAIEWSFLPPNSPHMGGVWERLVRSVKTVLKSLTKQQLLTDEQLLSFLAEVEKILNGRPLTTVSLDPKDSLPLTPNHLLLLKGNPCYPSSLVKRNYVQRRWQLIQSIANTFFKRFINEYLPLLHERNKWTKAHENLRVNDIVLLMDENTPRGNWPLAQVVDVNTGRDGLVRSVKVRTNNSFKVRPVNKVVFLEHHD